MPTFVTKWYNLKLADGSQWSISAGEEQAAVIVSQFGEAMQLSVMDHAAPWISTDLNEGKPLSFLRLGTRSGHRLMVFWGEESRVIMPRLYALKSFEDHWVMACRLPQWESEAERFFHLVQLSLILARQSQAGGGVLLHGALAESGGRGVILAGAGGTGKTTASGRLPAPWKSLSDDLALVVRDSHKNYWAHPWPTWSRFLNGGGGGAWGVQKAIPLEAIFFLAQADEDRAVPLGDGEAVSPLLSSVRQASSLMIKGLKPEEIRALHLEWFYNLCSLSRAVPSHRLDISLTGPFWKEIERVLENIRPEA